MGCPEIILVSPAQVKDNIDNSPFYSDFGKASVEISKSLAKEFQAVSEKFGCAFLDAASVAEVSDTDAIHLTAYGHKQLAHALAEII